MFADSLLESPLDERSRRGWTTLLSFALQAIAVSGLLLLPLLFTQALPQFQLISELVAPASPAPLTPPAVRNAHANTSNLSADGKMITPLSVPKEVVRLRELNAPPPVDPGGPGIPGGTGDPARPDGVLNSIGNGANVIVPPPPPATHSPRVSRMMEGNLVYRVQPQYPTLARQARVQGVVVLRAMISREGRIENLQVVSGPPLLVRAAMDAVLQWRYRPYCLNNEPVEVETQVTVNFTLTGG